MMFRNLDKLKYSDGKFVVPINKVSKAQRLHIAREFLDLYNNWNRWVRQNVFKDNKSVNDDQIKQIVSLYQLLTTSHYQNDQPKAENKDIDKDLANQFSYLKNLTKKDKNAEQININTMILYGKINYNVLPKFYYHPMFQEYQYDKYELIFDQN